MKIIIATLVGIGATIFFVGLPVLLVIGVQILAR